jgi:hypothetical protein
LLGAILGDGYPSKKSSSGLIKEKTPKLGVSMSSQEDITT